MKQVLAALALAFSGLALTTGAQAGVMRAVIDFETPIDPAGAPPFLPYLTHEDVFLQPGLRGQPVALVPFSASPLAEAGDLVGEIIDGAGSPSCAGIACPVNNASRYVNMYNDAVLGIDSAGGPRFSVKSFKASFIGNGDPTFAVPGAVLMRGVRDNAVVAEYLAVLFGPSATGALSFSTYMTDPVFAAEEFDFVLAIGFACTAGSGQGCTAYNSNRAQFALDDIAIEHLPEPASLALIGVAGLAAVGARRRRAA